MPLKTEDILLACAVVFWDAICPLTRALALAVMRSRSLVMASMERSRRCAGLCSWMAAICWRSSAWLWLGDVFDMMLVFGYGSSVTGIAVMMRPTHLLDCVRIPVLSGNNARKVLFAMAIFGRSALWRRHPGYSSLRSIILIDKCARSRIPLRSGSRSRNATTASISMVSWYP